MERTKKPKKTVKELSGSPGKRSSLASSTLLEKDYVSWLDTVQNVEMTKKTESTVKELSDSPGKCSSLALSTLIENVLLFGLIRSKM